MKNSIRSKVTLLLFFFIATNSILHAQDIESLKIPDKKDLFGISGSINAGAFISTSNRQTQERIPFGYNLNGNLNFRLYKINIPVSLTYSDNRFSTSYNLPTFKRFGMSPYYKWVKLHAGWRNMKFSRYTLNGSSFLGGGIELSPGLFRFSAMVGKLDQGWNRQDIQNILPIEREIILPQRLAYAISAGIKKDNNSFKVILFRASDRTANTSREDLNEFNLSTGSNISLGTQWKVRLLKKVTFQGDWATSAITQNNDDFNIPTDSSGGFMLKISNALIPINRSSQSFIAGESKLDFRSKLIRLGIKFKHIDPFYSTYGLQYIRNDFQNYTGNVGFSFLKSKVNINGSIGYQRNNLDKLKEVTSLRKIYSGNLSAQVTKNWNLSVNYSNFASDQREALLEVNDTLRIANINQNLNINQKLKLKTKNKQSISLNYSKNQFTSLTAQLQDSENNSNTAGLSHQIRFKEKGLRIKTGITYSNNMFREQSSKRFGGTVNVSKPFFEEKLFTNTRLRYQRSIFEDQQDGYVINFGINLRYKITSKMSLSFNNNLLQRQARVQNSIKSWRGSLSYSLSF